MRRINRRDFLKNLGAAASVVALGQVRPRLWISDAHAAPVAGRKCVYIFQDGGSDVFTTLHHSSWTGTLTQIRPTLSARITGGEYLALGSSNFSIHPRLTEYQTMFNSGEAAFVMQVGQRLNPSGSHEEAQMAYRTGVDNTRLNATIRDGWINRVAQANFTDRFQVLDRTGGGTAASAGAFKPLALTSFNALTFNGTVNGENRHRIGTAFTVISQSGADPEAVAVQQSYTALEQSVSQVAAAISSTTLNPVFPTTGLGNQLRDIFIAMVNFPTVFASAQFGGFDLHSTTDPILAMGAPPQGQSSRHAELNAAVAAFRANCQRVGIWQDMSVVVVTEFGRTNRENSTQGVDHGRGSVALLAGGAVNGGTVYGPVAATTDLTSNRNSLPVAVSVVDLYSDILVGMGYNPAAVFPGHARTPLGFMRA